MIKFVAGIILYLLIISTFFGFVVSEAMNEDLPGLNTEIYSGDIVDFSGNTDFEKLIDASVINSQQWIITDNILIYGGIYSGSANERPIFFKGIKPTIDNIYEVKYFLNNSEDLPFEIWITEGGLFDSDAYILYYSGSTLTMYNPYIHTFVGEYLKTEMFSQTISLSGENTITTKIDYDNQNLKIYINDNLIQDIPTEIKSSYNHYGGIIITETGNFSITRIESTVLITDATDNTNFLSLVASLVLWSVPEKYMPLIFNIILIKFPLLLLTISVAFYIRGVS